MQRFAYLMICFAVTGLVVTLAVGHEATDRGGPDVAADLIGRYQAVSAGDRRVFVIDTATGNTWSRNLLGGGWKQEGNPARDAPFDANDAATVKASPEDKPETPDVRRAPEGETFTVAAKGTAPIPQTEGLIARVGVPSQGRVLLSITAESGTVVENT
ncbi:MAG: hypothetical protein R3336_09265, partial [Phycisphaeraceae bacterium]|nr:hypothetical protein [Phycisphaeraceae bacterium]